MMVGSISTHYHLRTGQKLEVIERDTDRDFFMMASEAKDYGIIDEVMESSAKLK